MYVTYLESPWTSTVPITYVPEVYTWMYYTFFYCTEIELTKYVCTYTLLVAYKFVYAYTLKDSVTPFQETYSGNRG